MAFYYTKPKSWYPVPDRAASLTDIPLAPQLPPAAITAQDARRMKEWAHAFGAAVRQRTVTQETIIARTGSLSSFLYQRDIVPGQAVDLTGDVGHSVGDAEDGDEYESSSSAEEEEVQENESQTLFTLSEEVNFLLGGVSTFG